MKRKDAGTMKKNSKRKTAWNKPLLGQEKIEHYNAILIEELTSKFNFVIEKVMSLDEKFTHVLNESIQEIRQDHAEFRLTFKHIFSELEANQKNWETNWQLWQENKKCWGENKRRWDENKKRWDENERRWENNEQRWEKNNTQWASNAEEHQMIFAKLDLVAEKVQEHDAILKRWRA